MLYTQLLVLLVCVWTGAKKFWLVETQGTNKRREQNRRTTPQNEGWVTERINANNVTKQTCTTGDSDFQNSSPSQKWLDQCEGIMKTAKMFNNFSHAVGHGIHSMTLQDIRSFFEKDANSNNGIPTTNRDLCSEDQNIVTQNAPDIPQKFASIGLHTLDFSLQNMDDPNYMQMTNVLARLTHAFHMHDIWTKAQAHYRRFVKEGVDPSICACALDTFENGIHQELRNIFFYFREQFGLIIYWYEYRERGPKDPTVEDAPSKMKRSGRHAQKQDWPELTDSTSWKKWKQMLHKSMLSPEDVKKVALFIYCTLN